MRAGERAPRLPPPAWIWLAFIAMPPGLYSVLLSASGVGGFFVVGLIVALTMLVIGVKGRVVFGAPWTLGFLSAVATAYAFGAVLSGTVSDRGTRGAIALFISLPVIYLASYNTGSSNPETSARTWSSLRIAFVCSCVGAAALWLLQTAGALDAALGPGLFDNRNHFGYFMAMGFAATLPEFRPHARKAPWLAAGTLLCACALASLSRGAWVSVGVVSLIAMFQSRRYLQGAIATGSIAVLAATPAFTERLAQEDVSSGRFTLWELLLPRGPSEWLTGRGVGYMWSLDQFDVHTYGGYISERNEYIYSHNDFLFLLVEVGTFGMVLWVIVVAHLLSRARRTAANGDTPAVRANADAFLLMTAALLTGQMVDTMFFGSTLIMKWCALAPTAEPIRTSRVLRVRRR